MNQERIEQMLRKLAEHAESASETNGKARAKHISASNTLVVILRDAGADVLDIFAALDSPMLKAR